jgi:hypothetical protein
MLSRCAHLSCSPPTRSVTSPTTRSATAGNTAWTAVLAGLIPILGIAAVGIIVYAFVRKGPER